jgi:hypothetical protein
MNNTQLVHDLERRIELLEAGQSSASGFATATNNMAQNVYQMVKRLNQDQLDKIDSKLHDTEDPINDLYCQMCTLEEVLDNVVKMIVVNEGLNPEERAKLTEVLVKFLQRDIIPTNMQ